MRLTRSDIDAPRDDRFHRLKLIEWWRQDVIASARFLVVGAGALGNEILKNLALLGARRVVVVDRDRVERSNLSRSVLFRESDEGRPKAEAAAARVAEIYPEARARAVAADAVSGVGLGLYRWADVVLAGLDNREARWAINKYCRLVGRPWIDGAIENFDGVARLFAPGDGPCYECTMGERDWAALRERMSCTLLSREELESGKVPTTPTAASIVAAVQVQQAVQLLHGRATLAGRGFVYSGASHEAYTIAYERKADCPRHDPPAPVREVDLDSSAAAEDVVEMARLEVGEDARVEMAREIVSRLDCACGASRDVFAPRGAVSERDAVCTCGAPMRPQLAHRIDARWGRRALADSGVPPWDILEATGSQGRAAYELRGDRPRVLDGDA